MKILWRIVGAIVALPLLMLAGFLAWDVATYDRAAWRRDYEHVKRELAQNYANLDWIVEQRSLDIAALDRQTGDAIDNAHSRVRAVLALRAFLRAFNDPHLRLALREDAPAQTAAEAGGETEEPVVASCAEAGYETGEDTAFVYAIDRLPGWTPLRTEPFPTGVAGDVGVLRIPSFGEIRYLSACTAAFLPGLTDYELQLAVRAALQEELRTALAELQRRGAARLLVDVSGNGGGTEWVSEVIQLMTDKELTRAPTLMADPECDRFGIWRGEPVCPVLAGEEAPMMTMTGTGEWNGPLLILADNETGSASEDFIAWLQQNGVARVIGQRTHGAGCGYIDGGGRIRLQAGPFDVRAPNCARFLNNGVNEIEGIAPDVALDFGGGDDADAAALWAAVN
jgi:hypothetical protein